MGKGFRTVFFGTPDFAVPCLEALHSISNVSLVVTQPDKRSGRGMKFKAPAVKEKAKSLGLEVIQPTSVRTEEFWSRLEKERPDVIVVVAYGKILPKEVLEMPPMGCVNVHASLLPRWRGAAPIHMAICQGDKMTGVSLMKMEEGLDTGPVFFRKSVEIGENERTDELSQRLALLGGESLREALPSYLNGELHPHPQDNKLASYAPLLKKEDGLIEWKKSAKEIHNLVRGLSPWPGAFTWLGKQRLKILCTEVSHSQLKYLEPGQMDVEVSGQNTSSLFVACGRGNLQVHLLQLEGKRAMDAQTFLAGYPGLEGKILKRKPS